MKKIIISTILIILILTLTGCGYGEYKGNVIDKQYTPARTVVQIIHTGKTIHPYTVHHPETYQIKIQKEENGETKITWITISKEQYENIQIGDYWGG